MKKITIICFSAVVIFITGYIIWYFTVFMPYHEKMNSIRLKYDAEASNRFQIQRIADSIRWQQHIHTIDSLNMLSK